MSKQEFTFDYAHYAPLDALPESDRELAARAADACGTAYAPYSGFRVGAAALLEDGTILTASNQESEVFPSGMCAERSLLYYLQANFSGVRIVALATASVPGERECSPVRRLSAGACRYRKTTGFPDPRGDVLRTQCYGSTGSAAVVTLYF